ncbi:MAG: hypothetical protein LBL13_05910 [Bacteroidales bacterium]|jgi:hypothetical protein|nr:hypothetical protein [Bacteroidales bacterium]
MMKKKLAWWLVVICVLIPLVGVIMAIVYATKGEKGKAANAIIAAVVGFIINLCLILS